MITEIFVVGQRLDITADISSLLTFAIDDIKDFASRQTTFSKTVVLPGTANNNRVFGGLFETGISNDYDPTLDNIGFNFNPSVSAQCVIFQDFMQTFSGTLRIIEIDIDQHRIEYQVALNGNLTSLSVALSSVLLSDLDFSAYNQPWTVANIVSSWDNPPGRGVYFPLADYGTYSALKHDWDFHTLRPALYVKEYIDKMFASSGDPSTAIVAATTAADAAKAAALAGGATPVAAQAAYDAAYAAAFAAALPAANAGAFRYQCDLFNTDRFKRLVVPHNQKDLVSLKTGIVLNADATTRRTVVKRPSPLNGDVIFDSVTGGSFSYASGIFTYNGASSITATLAVTLAGQFNQVSLAQISIYKNGSAYYLDPSILSGGGISSFSRTYNISLPLNTGDTFNIHFQVAPLGFLFLDIVDVISATLHVSTTSVISAPLDYGDTIDLSFAIPQNIRQIDFLTSIVKLFNLYVYEDQFDDRLIHISPFIDFYTSSSENAVDWTYKMDRNQAIKIKPMSELNSRLYKFNYADDSDFWNDLYKKRYNQGYGSYIFDSLYEFATQTNDLKLIFASTPLVGYSGEEKVYPTIFKRSGTTEDRTDSVIRIMQTKKIYGVSAWSIVNGATTLGTYTTYGYAGHFDDPDNPDNDLNFGAVNELFFELLLGDFSKTQFNIYWSGYMAEITDKDSKLLTAKFYLTPLDIFNLSFAKYITVDGTLFRLNKITDYNASIPGTCTVELIKVINTSYSYPLGSTPETDRILDWETGDELEYSPGMPLLFA